MKKYIKPDLFYENYELSQNIAVCAWDMTQTDKKVCVAEGDISLGLFDGLNLFTEGPRCNVTEEVAESFCYEPSSSGYGLFNS